MPVWVAVCLVKKDPIDAAILLGCPDAFSGQPKSFIARVYIQFTDGLYDLQQQEIAPNAAPEKIAPALKAFLVLECGFTALSSKRKAK